jgi:hypothetical protein
LNEERCFEIDFQKHKNRELILIIGNNFFNESIEKNSDVEIIKFAEVLFSE